MPLTDTAVRAAKPDARSRKLFDGGGLYAVNLVRRVPALRRRDPALVGGPMWRALRLTAPVTLDLLPNATRWAGIAWPHLTNNFMLLESR